MEQPQLDLGWMDDAACLTTDEPDDFFSDRPAVTTLALCRRCPVIEDCRRYIDEIEGQVAFALWEGIWAGETARQRRSRRETAPGTCHLPSEGA